MTHRRDIALLFSTRIIRLFCYGFLSVILALYLTETGLDENQIGLLFSFTLGGDAAISLWLTTSADRLGRKRTLIVGAALMLMAWMSLFGALAVKHDDAKRIETQVHQSAGGESRIAPAGSVADGH